MDLQDAPFFSVDVETTGLDLGKDEIIAFACLPIRLGRIVVHEAYYTLVKSQNYRIDSMKYHGISEGDLEEMPIFEQIAGEILERTDGVLVGHSVEFDYAFLRKHFRKMGIRLKREAIDIVKIEEWLGEKTGRRAPDLTLEGLMKKYGLTSYYRHNAFADAFFTAQIFQFELPELSQLGVKRLDQLIHLTGGGSKIWRVLFSDELI
ncbi:MAG TPA: 3'-5' exonuclease [Syntrophobacteraceae bacterium]|nr:3'-5' exonuclease [Syntrophobacteraceae bacterium]